MRLYLSILAFLVMQTTFSQNFISVEGTQFKLNGADYQFLGTNFWYGINLASAGPGGDRERLIRELDHLNDLGVKNLRIMAASEGPDTEPWRMSPALQTSKGKYNHELLEGLDFLLSEMGKRNMHAVVCLNNFWPWSGGMAQYVNWETGKPIPYPPPAEGGKWLKYMNFSSRFFKNEKAKAASFEHIKKIVARTNSVTGQAYRNDPTIMAWQLANEPRDLIGQSAYLKWVDEASALIKSLDSNHLVSVGSEGNAFVPFSRKFKRENRLPNIDYATMHIWIQNWGWYDPERPEKTFPKALKKAKRYVRKHVKQAKKLGMPLVLEEFGIARDGGSHDPKSSTEWRDRYYREMFSLLVELMEKDESISGCNFWAWGGEGRPRHPASIWKVDDDWTGDPPFEKQGWYSVFDKDEETLKVLREFAERMR